MDLNTKEFANLIKDWIEDKKGFDTEVIDVSELTSLAEVFVIASGSSDRNVQAIADFIEIQAKEMEYPILNKEGRQGGRWILLDFNNIIVHVFHQEEREFYNLERLWSDGKKL
ncbi:ribosome silencing factor [Alkalibaculum sp. M08DMB]|uniref:Ribosomal silencing factor RsfS n=1 Tax=Alkalibaculum sporogenes TaxID=2655001 RepID=A0A6A7K953_9FIRM|nr:ribosome silencing factor [Alkalibaculum sporogenes]MPW25922.1 ribosome silencing factor [Alkalibaculum sporogenes]